MPPKFNFGGAPKCPKCDQSVYHAEQLMFNNVAWHKTCFQCGNCNKKLETGTACDHEGMVYCRPCHGKNFGPKGYGFGGGGAGVMSSDKPAE